MAKRILVAQCVLIGIAVAAILLRELPGAIRELRMWRMARLRKPTTLQAGTQAARSR